MLHLATKPLFASIVRVWAKDDLVKAEFEALASGGAERLQKLLDKVEQTVESDRKNW